jgi:hypothetical protein
MSQWRLAAKKIPCAQRFGGILARSLSDIAAIGSPVSDVA